MTIFSIKPYVCTILLICCLLPLSSTAKVYKWTDKDGNVHFSQTPRDADSQDEEYKLRYRKDTAPPSVPNKQKGQPTTQSATKLEKAADQKPQTAQEKVAAMEKQKQEDDKKAAHEAKENAVKQANCSSAQKRLVNISQGGRIYDVDKKGNRSYWDDNTRQAKISEAQSVVSEWCG